MPSLILNDMMEKKGCQLLDLNASQIVTFAEGIPGFEKIKEYCILFNEQEQPFAHLSALGGFNLEFIVVSPWIMLPSYKPDVSEDDLKAIDSPEDKDLFLLSLVALNDADINETTINLAAPIIINIKTGKAKQVVIRNMKDYSAQHKIVNNT